MTQNEISSINSQDMPTILVTGFEPFGGQIINPALEALGDLPDEIDGVHIKKVQVPVVYAQAGAVVLDALRSSQADAVVCVGQAAGRSSITVERVAINVDDATAADNEGDERHDRPIRDDGPAAYFSTLPVRNMIAAIRQAGVPADISDTAGTYVCNHLMYSVLDGIASEHLPAIAGFVHVPLLHEQVIAQGDMAGKPSMSLEDIVRGLTAAISAVARAL